MFHQRGLSWYYKERTKHEKQKMIFITDDDTDESSETQTPTKEINDNKNENKNENKTHKETNVPPPPPPVKFFPSVQNTSKSIPSVPPDLHLLRSCHFCYHFFLRNS